MLLPYQIHLNSSLQWQMGMYFLLFMIFGILNFSFQCIVHWRNDLSTFLPTLWQVGSKVASYSPGPKGFGLSRLRSPRVWFTTRWCASSALIKNCQRWRWHRCLHCLHSLHYVYCFLYLHCMRNLHSFGANRLLCLYILYILLWALWRVSVVMGMGWMV